MNNLEIVQTAYKKQTIIPAFNIPYLPMMQAVVKAVADEDSFAFIQAARLEWIKFKAGSLQAVREEYSRCGDPAHTRLHLDHVPVIDEDDEQVDFLAVISEAIGCGYQSVMVDGSRLPFDKNVDATRQAVRLAHENRIPCEAELGAVLGHEKGPLPPYDELFSSGKGFTDILEAADFVQKTGCDWLSVAVGNVHGAISQASRNEKKLEARIDLAHLRRLRDAAQIPLVLHGGSGIPKDYILQSVAAGIAKINVGTEIRQAYEQVISRQGGIEHAREAVYNTVRALLCNHFEVSGNAGLFKSPPGAGGNYEEQ
ncbi:MAG: class II fructose-bisphosphate aldolase [Clostridiales bacterium]|jgi:ketose-bisphosphate aldolase|nr:class II fructose-bisphosphate aldolase [Clostridiales bacterium]